VKEAKEAPASATIKECEDHKLEESPKYRKHTDDSSFSK
jgi:hypothetical protein